MGSLDKVKLTSGKVLRGMRYRFGYTQKDVSKTIGISVSNLSALENDRRNLGVELAAKFSMLYGVRVDTLLFPNGLESIKGHNSLLKKIKKLKEAA